MRILIVEDEHKIANALRRGLEQESFAVDVAYTGQEGQGFALTEDYDVIVLDRMLPGNLDGVQLCRDLRKKGNHTPILMLTAKDAVADRVEGLNAGADDYLVKPFAFEELLARLRALARRPQDALGVTLQVENLTLDTAAHEVRRAGKPIQLSATEFALLEYLMRHPHRISTKEAIIAHVWDYDADVLPNTVEVYVGYLRSKIDKPFSGSPLLQTVRGFGYRLGSPI